MLRRFVTHGVILALALGVGITPGARPAEAQMGSCEFILGFRTLHDMIPGESGDCIENEWHNPENGDGLQRTTRGLMVWRKFDNWTAFTNGYMTWINGPFGLQARLNSERFAWESAAPPPAIPVAQPAQPQQVELPVPSASDAPPTISLDLSDDRVGINEAFTVRLRAEDDNGLDVIWWWASSTNDDDLRDTHRFDCKGASPCRRSWDVSTADDGRITIHALARDTNGQQSDEATVELRVRDESPTPTPTKTPAP